MLAAALKNDSLMLNCSNSIISPNIGLIPRLAKKHKIVEVSCPEERAKVLFLILCNCEFMYISVFLVMCLALEIMIMIMLCIFFLVYQLVYCV